MSIWLIAISIWKIAHTSQPNAFIIQKYSFQSFDTMHGLKKKKWVKMVKLFDFYGISEKDLWGAYGWTWDIVDFFVKSIHCPL